MSVSSYYQFCCLFFHFRYISVAKFILISDGNIEKVYEKGELGIRYQYDNLNRLIREDNKALGKTYVFVYDNNGNIVKKREFNFKETVAK